MANKGTTLRYDPSVVPDNSASAHVADPTAYGKPDTTQQRFVGQNATVIPRAKGNLSMGHSRFPIELNIDPKDPATGEGGRKVDLSRVDKDVMNKALATADSAEEAWDIVRSLSEAPAPAPAPVKKAATVTQPTTQQNDLLAALGAIQVPSTNPPPVVQQPVLQPIVQQHVPEPPMQTQNPIVQQPALDAIQQQIGALVGVVTSLVRNQAAPTPAPEPEPRPEKDEPKRQGKSALEHLDLNFLGEGAEGSKPLVPVVLQMGPGGQASVKFHKVVVYGGLVVLVYDTRWDGVQFFPPAVDYPIGVKLPAENKTYRVYSRDCVFPLGKLELCVLVIVSDPAAAEEEYEEAPATTGIPQLAPALPKRTIPEIVSEGPPAEEEYMPSIL